MLLVEQLVEKSLALADRVYALARGRIVLFNVAYTSYGETSRFRWNGASRAARHGAVAMLIRSDAIVGYDQTRSARANLLDDGIGRYLGIGFARRAAQQSKLLPRLEHRHVSNATSHKLGFGGKTP